MVEPGRRTALALGAIAMSGLATAAEPTAFDFRMESLDGGPLDLATFRGRPMLVVNTASFCGFTPQYAGLQRLQDRFATRGLVVLGVPSNDFNQESADARTIKHFCEATYAVTFPMTMPARVRGAQAVPLFAFLATHGGGPPRWNFHKYLVARDGRRVQGFPTATEPDAPALIRAVEAALAAPTA
ncbi:glutathione peroxidase [Belnapia sp. T18]|uniref:Glutathione peroxidase n=1 Tax=Belnapia arida TaxID=2804533 RepID=A0ABS1TYH9_9PROT|nr:glutathione peroxidase [Belnapia arida]MBL6077483.1 glutathione peroxidase [Belnapia arida]